MKKKNISVCFVLIPYFFKFFLSLFLGGKTYDKDHVVIMLENDERPSQQWQIELL